MEEIVRKLLDWPLVLVAGALLVVFPLVFYISSLDKTAVKVRKVKYASKKPRPVQAATARPAEDERRFREERSNAAPRRRLEADHRAREQKTDDTAPPLERRRPQ